VITSLSGSTAADQRASDAALLGRVRRWTDGNRTLWVGVRLRQRDAPPQGVAGTVPTGEPAGKLRRVPRPHRGPRLPKARILAFRRLGDGPRARLGSAALLVLRKRRMVDLYSCGPLPAEPGGAGLPRQLLRG